MVQIAQEISSAINTKSQLHVICIDLATVFTCVNHEIFLRKVSNIGLHLNSLDGLEVSLGKRKKRFTVNVVRALSIKGFIEKGIPQVSSLDPLLFAIFTSDLSDDLNTYFGVLMCINHIQFYKLSET